MRSALKLILPLQPPWVLRLSAIGLATAEATLLQNSRRAKTAESNIVKAINGQLLPIRSRIATVTPAATTTVAQIEFAANQKRQEVTKLDENERDETFKIRLFTVLGKKPLKFRLPLIVVFYGS